jgi:ABC-type spermidine/putrescine transport system permease subunit II
VIRFVSDAMECNAACRVVPSVTICTAALRLIAVTKCLTTSGGSGSDASYVFDRSDWKTTHHAEMPVAVSHLVRQFSVAFAFAHSSFIVSFFLPVFALPVCTATCCLLSL